MDKERYERTEAVYRLLCDKHDIIFSSRRELRQVLNDLYNFGCKLSVLSNNVRTHYYDYGNGISLSKGGEIFTIVGIYNGNKINYEDISPESEESEEDLLCRFYELMKSI